MTRHDTTRLNNAQTVNVNGGVYVVPLRRPEGGLGKQPAWWSAMSNNIAGARIVPRALRARGSGFPTTPPFFRRRPRSPNKGWECESKKATSEELQISLAAWEGRHTAP